MTTPMAMEASSIVVVRPSRTQPPAARGKKMTRSASRGTSSKARTIRASRRPARAALGDGGPHALFELAAELLHEQLLLLGHLDVPFGDEHLAVPGLHAKEPHGERRL